jgi:hypothetical protein
MPSRKNFESNVKARRVTAAARRQSEIGGFNKTEVEAYINRITENGERKNSKMIRAQVLAEVEALKKVKM